MTIFHISLHVLGIDDAICKGLHKGGPFEGVAISIVRKVNVIGFVSSRHLRTKTSNAW